MEEKNKILNLLLVEDSSDDAELIVLELKKSGLNFNWNRVQTEIELKKQLSLNIYDLVISDYMMPDILGIDVVKIINKFHPELPIIIISGQIGEEQAIETLKAGASDYLIKENLIRLPSAIFKVIQDKKNEIEMEKSRVKMRDLTMHLEESRENERLKIALNLHDDLGQKLTAINIDLNWLKNKLTADNPHLIKKIDSIGNLVNETIHSIQKISADLRPSILDDLGLFSAIEWQLEEFEKNTGIKCIFEIEEDEIKINADLAVLIFRIFQEAITNVSRHAKATQINLSLDFTDEYLKLIIKDNGIGITKEDIDNPDSFGLFSIKERAKNGGGIIQIKGIKDVGTEIILEIPIENKL